MWAFLDLRDFESKLLSPGDGSPAVSQPRRDPAVGSSRSSGPVVPPRGKRLSRSRSGRGHGAGEPRGARMIPNMFILRLRELMSFVPGGLLRSAGTRANRVPDR